MLKEKRTTRGLRMSSLVGKAVEEDDAFWKNDVSLNVIIIFVR